jgi:nucleolin
LAKDSSGEVIRRVYIATVIGRQFETVRPRALKISMEITVLTGHPTSMATGEPIEGDLSKTVYVRNISYTTLGEALSRALSQFGEIASARIITGWSNGERSSRGFGFVEFKTAAAFEAAIAKSREVELEGRTLVISACRPRGSRKRDTAFIRGIAAGTTPDQLKAFFKNYNPTEVRIIREDSGESKGFAFVQFATEEDQTRAVNENQTIQLNGAESAVRFARPPQRRFGGYRRGPPGGGAPGGERESRRAPRGPPPEGGGGGPRRAPRGPRREPPAGGP